MHKIALFLVMLVVVARVGAGCSSTDTGSTSGMMGCAPVMPDGGVSSFVCDIAWSCAADTEAFELQCTLSGGNYRCDCLSGGVTTRTFMVNPFTCDATDAMPIVNSNSSCGWSIM